jgi:hypothetical protein
MIIDDRPYVLAHMNIDLSTRQERPMTLMATKDEFEFCKNVLDITGKWNHF